MKRLLVLFFSLSGALSYGQQVSSRALALTAPTRFESRRIEKRASTSATSAPVTPMSSSPTDRSSHVSFAPPASTSEPSSPRPPARHAPVRYASSTAEDQARLPSERQAVALDRIANALEKLLEQNAANIKLSKSIRQSLDTLIVAHVCLHDDESNLDQNGQRALLYLQTERERIIRDTLKHDH